jgi:hypothetical protein
MNGSSASASRAGAVTLIPAEQLPPVDLRLNRRHALSGWKIRIATLRLRLLGQPLPNTTLKAKVALGRIEQRRVSVRDALQ